MILYNNTVVLTEGNFTFVPSNNVSASYEISNSTDLGALYATGLDFNVSDMGEMAGNDTGNMTEKSLILESIEGYQNNNETQEKWFILINGVQAPDDIGMNQVSDGDEVNFLYTLEEGGEPVLEEAKYVVMIKVAREAPPEANDLIETATQAGNFTTLLGALNATNLTDTLKGEGPYTVFAPTDEAFAALPNGTVEGLLNDTEALKNILLYHVAGEKLMAADVVNMTNITTLQGSELSVNVTEEGVFVGDAKIIMQDVNASNGVIHVIDAVLTPPAGPSEEKDIIETATSKGFKTLRSALNATNLTDTLKGEGPYTLFAPTDNAFAALPNGTLEALLNDTDALKNILLYHVAGEKLMAADVVNMTNITTLQGSELPVNVTEEGVFVGDAKIILQDLEASNGVIHVIDAVLTPPAGPSEEKDIIETASDAGSFTTLLGALNATNLTDTLKGEGPYTVFAPTDEAFAALPNGTVEGLLNDTEALKSILLYHVAGEKLMAADVVNMTNITTLQGSELPVNVTEEGVFVGDAKIIVQDVNASNGVIHAIDAVLIPPKELPSKWYFFSIPFKAENASVENLLAGVQYNALVYYNGSSGIYENVSTLEPLKGYWINIPGGVEFNASSQFASATEVSSLMSAPQSIKLYPGWNAVGSPVKYNLTADSAFITIGDKYSKVMGPWITDEESGSGTYAFVGYNGLSGVLNGNQVGTDIFEVKPYEGYWVYMKQEGTFA